MSGSTKCAVNGAFILDDVELDEGLVHPNVPRPTCMLCSQSLEEFDGSFTLDHADHGK